MRLICRVLGHKMRRSWTSVLGTEYVYIDTCGRCPFSSVGRRKIPS